MPRRLLSHAAVDGTPLCDALRAVHWHTERLEVVLQRRRRAGTRVATAALAVLGLMACGGGPCPTPTARAGATAPASTPLVFTEIGAGSPALDSAGNAGIVLAPAFVDAAQPDRLTATVCGVRLDWPRCRPASSFDGGVSLVTHESDRFAPLTANGWAWHLPLAVLSPVRSERIYFAAAGHPWDTPEPKGGLWRSDDDGRTWTDNLLAGEPGESGMIERLAADPYDADKVWINRGYDYGNISVSFDAGASFTILCGFDNVSKNGGVERDAYCGSGSGTFAVDFERQRLFYKHHFVTVGVEYSFAGTLLDTYEFSGLGFSASAHLDKDSRTRAPAIHGLQAREGALSASYLADGSGLLYLASDEHTPWVGSPDFRTGAPINAPAVGGERILLAHPTRTCAWILQAEAATLQTTFDCGKTWSRRPSAGLPDNAVILAAAFVPNDSGDLLVFTDSGRRFRTNIGMPGGS